MEKTNSFRARIGRLTGEYRLFSIFIIMALILEFATQGLFFHQKNIINLFNQNAMLGILSIGQFLVIVTGGIDLSVGTVMMMCSVFYVMFQNLGAPASALLSILLGTLFGLINALMITKAKINSFITTLGTMTIAEGIGYVLVNGHTIFKIDKTFLTIGKLKFLGASVYDYIWIFLLVLMLVIIQLTPYGIKLYSTGGNASATRLSGVNTDGMIASVYIISGFLAGVVGVLYTARLATGDPSVSGTFNTDTITAVVIAGTSMLGGEGKLYNVFLGVLILGMLSNFMNTVGIPSSLHVGVKGVILVFTVLMNIYQQNKH